MIFRIIILFENLTETEAFSEEIRIIQLHGRKDLGTGCLRNLTDGGEGPSGYTHTQDTLDKMSEARSGKKSPNFGKFMTIEQKKKLSESHKGQLAWNKGITGRKWFHDPITNKSIICNPNDAPVNYVLGRSNN